MSDITIRKAGRAGRITLTRPKALNAVTYEMCQAIEAALDEWRDDDEVALVIIDAEGDKAFSAGGDIQKLYETGRAGDFAYGQKFWADEYRLNAKIREYPKPYIAFMQGFTMGGGVGISCHGSHRIVGESSQIAMPECGIGLVPDVGGSLMLAQAPGRLGEYLGTTGARMGPADAIMVGFADSYVPQEMWSYLISKLEETGDVSAIGKESQIPPDGTLAAQQAQIDALFGGDGLIDVLNALRSDESDFAAGALKALSRSSPLSAACAIEMVHRLRRTGVTIRDALELEYRFTHRAMEHGDFLEGIRAAVIDKDRSPNWQHDLDNPPSLAATKMLMPLGENKLTFDEGD
ncbi:MULTISPECIES: enoyl-CoA hydratase/isomerase family protein [unclassified Roseovarius]|uniref:enoyl-CoA hydratase/isomerase family protein n=1 Tax=unclassified Roseovarius TaxID=2614913 RepID=UPI00273FE188|nr:MULTISPECIES: enoyl-CoA hydratase/isomerase family protein [unclassified Roseovarius]